MEWSALSEEVLRWLQLLIQEEGEIEKAQASQLAGMRKRRREASRDSEGFEGVAAACASACSVVKSIVLQGALPLLYYARLAKDSPKEGMRCLLCIRLLAQQLQSLAQVIKEELGINDGETGTGECDDSDALDLALVLSHWVSTEWCSPRIEVVDYMPCCGGYFLSKSCGHSALRAALDVVLFAPMPDGQEIGRQRLLHHGPWRGFSPVAGGWHTSYPAGAALHRWEEVTAAGLMTLAAARGLRESQETVESRAAVLVCGACDGLLCSFLAQHADIQVDVVEEEKHLEFLQKNFDLHLGGPGRIKGSRRVQDKKEKMDEKTELTEEENLYDGIVAMQPFGQPFGSSHWSDTWSSLKPGGLLLVERAPGDVEADALELKDLQDDPEIDSTTLYLLPRGARDLKDDFISPRSWFELLLERGGVRGGAPDVLEAQQTRVVAAGRVDREDVLRLQRLAQWQGCGREVRSPNSETWQVTFLQTEGFFATEAPDLLERFTEIARSVARAEGWFEREQIERLQARVIEWHEQGAPGPGIPDPRHYDMDSLITVDVMCSELGDFSGGELRFLELDGLKDVAFGFCDILVFQAHKYHCVAPVSRGCRRALVLELWDGPARTCPHRCTSFEPHCPKMENAQKALGRRLPFRLAARRESCEKGQRALSLLWQCNEPTQ